MSELFYEHPSEGWLDGLPLGNGRTGAMVLAARDGLRLQLNDGTAWSGAPTSELRDQPSADTAAAALASARELIEAGRSVEAEQALRGLQGRYAQAYLPFADVELQVDPQGPGLGSDAGSGAVFGRRLSLDEAVHRVSVGDGSGGRQDVRHGKDALVQDTFVSAPDGVVVHRLCSAEPLDLTLTLSTQLHQTGSHASAGAVAIELAMPADVAPGHEPDEPAVSWHIDGVTPLAGALAAGWQHDGLKSSASSTASGTVVRFSGVRELTFAAATETTFAGVGHQPQGTAGDCADRAAARVSAALPKPFHELRQRHVAAHRELYDRVQLVLGGETGRAPDTAAALPTDERIRRAHASAGGAPATDPGLLALLFDYGRYLLISSSRKGGLPATLQGLWNDEMQPPWSSGYTLNINTEMNYWAAGPAALPECHEPLLTLTEALAEQGRDTARRLYAARGWVAHHNSDAWAFSSPTSGDASWSQWPMGGIWLVRQLDEHRRFGSADGAWIDRLWKLAVGAAEFALDLLTDDGTGGLVTRPSTSPENRFVTAEGRASLTSGSAMDRALITELFSLVQELSAAVDPGHPILAEISRAMPRIPPPVISARGGILEWLEDLVESEPEHRHLSHLFFAYPGEGAASAALAAAVSRSLDLRGDDSTGWSLVWKMCLRARLGEPAKVSELMQLMVRPADAGTGQYAGGLYANLFAAHPPFQIDGNLGFTAALAETLLQSHRGGIQLLPALPDELPAGRFQGLIARPGLVVDLEWCDGEPTTVSIRARRAEFAGKYTVTFGTAQCTVSVGHDLPTTLNWRESADIQRRSAH